jgi:uncharacterized membrane protein
MSTSDQPNLLEPPASLLGVVHVVYALHALSLCIGAFGAASVVGAFLFGWPSIIAVIINYVKRGEAEGSWLESHFRLQIRTFWFALLAAAMVAAISAPLALILVGFATWAIGMFVLGIWASVRIAKGWLRLLDRKPV